ncbi:MAG: DUF817 domain-containing protein [Rhodanobacteraceae bacterium]|nr:DUF817 domain-containing protein [Rhodanobacteraceae bacterium]
METTIRVWMSTSFRRQLIRKNVVRDFLWFGLKEVRSCLFAGGFFAILALSKWLPLGDLPRYDFLLLAALGLQALLLWLRLETWEEVRVISLFHVLGFALEVFKTHPSIGSWSYPEAGYTKVLGVPLYAGFMYAAVASYMTQAWRQFELGLTGYPKHRVALPLALAIYANFFTHHFIGDWRWLLIAVLLWQFRHCRVHFTPFQRRYWMPMPLAFVLIGFFIWIAENIATFFGAWVYPDQHDGWQLVHWGKISSWSLLVVITFLIVAELQRSRQRRVRETWTPRCSKLSSPAVRPSSASCQEAQALYRTGSGLD